MARDLGRSPSVLLVVAVAVSAALAAWLLIGATHQTVSIHTAVPSSAEGAISIEADGWTYGVPLDGVRWIDETNTWHQDGRPDCLPAAGTTLPVTFGAVEVTVEGVGWRPVVWVDCR
jgi:ribose 1,5-bisphosphokinase PhnN